MIYKLSKIKLILFKILIRHHSNNNNINNINNNNNKILYQNLKIINKKLKKLK